MNRDEPREVELERLAQRLGVRAAERLDVERTAAAVVARLCTERARQRPWWSQPAWLRAAAVIVLMAGVGLVVRVRFMTAPAPVGQYVREDLQDLSADQLREVLGSLDETLNDVTIQPPSDDFSDLTTEQLQALLQSLEG
jgi:hypothetical protein